MSRLQLDLESLEAEQKVLSLSARGLTRPQYLAFCAANRDLRIERLASGEIVILAPAHSRTGLQNSEISAQLRNWARVDARGLAFDSSAGFDLPSGANYGPDAAWVLKPRIAALREDQKEDFLPLCPDFVVELRSRSDRLTKLKNKMREYIENGARLGWLIDPLTRTVHVYRPGVPEQEMTNPTELSGDPELPGFRLDLKPVWEPGL